MILRCRPNCAGRFIRYTRSNVYNWATSAFRIYKYRRQSCGLYGTWKPTAENWMADAWQQSSYIDTKGEYSLFNICYLYIYIVGFHTHIQFFSGLTPKWALSHFVWHVTERPRFDDEFHMRKMWWHLLMWVRPVTSYYYDSGIIGMDGSSCQSLRFIRLYSSSFQIRSANETINCACNIRRPSRIEVPTLHSIARIHRIIFNYVRYHFPRTPYTRIADNVSRRIPKPPSHMLICILQRVCSEFVCVWVCVCYLRVFFCICLIDIVGAMCVHLSCMNIWTCIWTWTWTMNVEQPSGTVQFDYIQRGTILCLFEIVKLSRFT